MTTPVNDGGQSAGLAVCPFCGSDANLIELAEGIDRPTTWRVECSSDACNPRPFTYRAGSVGEAVAAWNNRGGNVLSPTEPKGANPINDGGPAFPVTIEYGKLDCAMTMRDWFAGQVVGTVAEIEARGELSDMDLDHKDVTVGDRVASQAYAIADAMLRAREVKP